MPLPSHSTYRTVFYSLSVSLNLLFTILICLRIFVMRDKAVKVLGKLQAFFYNSLTTMFVESGGFFTIWSIVYLITLLSNSWAQNVFLQPYSYILVSCHTSFTTRNVRLPDLLGNYQNPHNHENGSKSCLVTGHHRSSYRWRTRLANFFNEHGQSGSSQYQFRTFDHA